MIVYFRTSKPEMGTCNVSQDDVRFGVNLPHLAGSQIVPTGNSDARINFRLSNEFKKTIEDAAAEMGQSISDFAISTLLQTARKILHDREVTRLSERDRQLFVAMLDDESSKPNDALVKAAKRYKRQVR